MGIEESRAPDDHTEGSRGRAARVPVRDKRRAPSASEVPQKRVPGAGAQVTSGPARAVVPEPHQADQGGSSLTPEPGPHDAAQGPSVREQELDARSKAYLDDLKRVQAEFANYRKRVMRDQAAAEQRASERLVDQLLPVLDNLERALDHDAGTSGMDLVYKHLLNVLVAQGLEEIPAVGAPFDPTVHEAVEVTEDAETVEPVNKQVYRKGYRYKGRVIRPTMVAVGHPVEPEAGEPGEGNMTPPGAAGPAK